MGIASLDHALKGATERSVFRSALSDQDLRDFEAVLTSSTRLFSSHTFDVDEIEDFRAASGALNTAWNAVTASLTGNRNMAEAVANSTELVGLLNEIRRVDSIIRVADTERRRTALNTVRKTLARFHDVDSVAELIEMVPEAVCQLGFDRAFISRIHDSLWVPEAVSVMGDPEWSEEIFRVGIENPQRLGPSLYESEIVRRRTGIVVTDVQHQPKVHKPIAETSLSRSYVAAPVMPSSSVIGFVHADRYFHRGEVDEFDRDMLSLFAEGISYVLHRAVLAERVRTLRAEINQLTKDLNHSVNQLTNMPVTLERPSRAKRGGRRLASAQTPSDPAYFAYQLAPDSPLTRRELEVLQLMAAGDTNARIANRLIVSEGTVKSHVKNILRKLSAANRAEAVARWLNLERTTSSTS